MSNCGSENIQSNDSSTINNVNNNILHPRHQNHLQNIAPIQNISQSNIKTQAPSMNIQNSINSQINIESNLSPDIIIVDKKENKFPNKNVPQLEPEKKKEAESQIGKNINIQNQNNLEIKNDVQMQINDIIEIKSQNKNGKKEQIKEGNGSQNVSHEFLMVDSNDMNNLSNKIESLVKKIDSLTTEIGNQNQNISSLMNKFDNQNQNISSLTNKIDTLTTEIRTSNENQTQLMKEIKTSNETQNEILNILFKLYAPGVAKEMKGDNNKD